MNKKIRNFLIAVVLIIFLCILCAKKTLNNINYGIDLQGGFEVLYRIETLDTEKELTEEDKENTYKALVKRIDSLGVSEPVIAFEGDNLLRVQLPGVSDEEEARKRISTTAALTFRDTSDNLLMTSDILGGNAKVVQNSQTFNYEVSLDIKDTKTFYNITSNISKKTNDNNKIVIWLDYDSESDSYNNEKDICGTSESNCISSAYVNEGLSSSQVVIQGQFTKDEAQELVDLINSGSLPTKLVEEATPRSVSASFGENTIHKTAVAGIIVLFLISLILCLKYRVSGLIGSLSLVVYTLIVFVLFNAVGGVLTLTGIAALILGIGMAVDSIIISNERIKDELLSGKKLINSYKEGNKSSIIAIIDANITTLIAAIVLYIFGESSVRGFATMLIITIIVTILTTVLLYRLLTNLLIESRFFDNKEKILLGNIKEHKKNNYIKITKYFIYSFVCILIVSIIFFIKNGVNFGVDFIGGTNVYVSSDNTNINEIKKSLSEYDIIDYGSYGKNEVYVKLSNILTEEEELKVINTLKDMGYDTSLNKISTLVTYNLTRNAIKSLIFALIGIIIYMIIRFNFNYALTGVLMLLHDVLVIIMFFIIFKIEVNFIIVASLLTIIGYSINDTIVVFDRMRSNKKLMYKSKDKLTEEELVKLINVSSNETINRNIWTSITTIISVVTLLCVNLSSIITFNIAVLIGLIAGTISSLIIGPYVYLLLERKRGKKKDDEDDEVKELLIKGINS